MTPTALAGAATATTDPCDVALIEASALGTPVMTARDLVSGVVSTLEPGRLTGSDAAHLYELLVSIERLTLAGRTLLATRIDDSGIWRDRGHRSPAVMLAELEGVPTGQARNTLEVGRRLSDLPGTEEALRRGDLSGPKVTELSGAAELDPDQELVLLAGAAEEPLQKTKERCQRARATSQRHDPDAAVRRIHAARNFSSWTDAEGAFCFQGRDTADRGAVILDQMQHTVGRLRKAAKARQTESGSAVSADSGPSERALRADAFFLLTTGRLPSRSMSTPAPRPPDVAGGLVDGDVSPDPAEVRKGPIATGDDDPGPPVAQIADHFDSDSDPPDQSASSSMPAAEADSDSDRLKSDGVDLFDPGDVIDRPPTCSVLVRVDLDALLRGAVGPGEVCEIDNQGPIPVSMARDLANDSFLRLVFHRAGDIRAVSHQGRTINRILRTALAYRDRGCVVPGCGVAFGLEIDHVVPFASGGPTELENLALICHHHHYLKTYEGWTLERAGAADSGEPTWSFTPMPEFGKEPDLGADLR